MALDPDAALINEMLAAMAANDDVLALAKADQLAAHDPEHHFALAMRAFLLLRQDEPKKAILEARRVAQLHPDKTLSWNILAQVATRLGNISQAQAAYERALKLDPNNADLLALYAVFMAEQRGPKIAEQVAQQALRTNPESPMAIAALGVVRFRQGRYAESRAELQRGLRIDPDHALLRSYMTILLRVTNDDSKADALVNLMEAENPETAEFAADQRKAALTRKTIRKLFEREEVQRELMKESEPRRILRVYKWLFLAAVIAILSVAVIAAPPKNVRGMAVPAIMLLAMGTRYWIYRDR